ncbi:MAG: phospholipase D-like domain-containing protein [Candidatus Altiarchaeota archaeon]
MAFKRKTFSILLIGLLLGVVLGIEAVELGSNKNCPQIDGKGIEKIVVLNDLDYAPQLIKVLTEASASIHVATFELKYYKSFPESASNKIIKQIIEAKKRGADVKIIVDEYAKDNSAVPLLEENNVSVKFDGENQTLHSKLFLIDGKKVFVGSTNPTYYGLEKNREANVYIEDEKTAEKFENWFDKIWISLL